MEWHATHTMKIPNEPPRRVMLNSGCYFTRAEWENSADPRVVENETGVPEVSGADLTVTVSPLRARGEGESRTPLRKPVTRITVNTTIRHKGKLRRLVVTLLPGDVLEMNLEGCRRSSTARQVSFRETWDHASKMMARQARAKRKARAS